MPKKRTIYTSVNEDGHLPGTRRQEIAALLSQYAGGPVVVEIRPYNRTAAQNRYLWGFIYPAIQAALADQGSATSADALHEHFKHKLLTSQVYEAFGTTHVVPPSSRTLTTTEFDDFMEAIRTDEEVLALGVYIEPFGSQISEVA